jgi:nicotinamide-nucleotide adenylyltransferase/phosphinothricin biosynthesis protein PhpF
MVHGRYQPFHLGHLACLEAAAARCRRLVVGITSPDRSHLRPEPADPARHLTESNPFTYLERLLMVTGAVRERGLATPVSVVPFPISEPALWPDYVPPGAVHFLRLYSPWGSEKAARLRAAGHEVVVLDQGGAKDVSGAEVRSLLRTGGDWRARVPPASAAVIERAGAFPAVPVGEGA